MAQPSLSRIALSLYCASEDMPGRRGGGGVLGLILLGVCRWPLRVPTLLKCTLWPITDTILGRICNFRDSRLVTFYFYFTLHEEHFTFHLQYKHCGTFANRKYEELS